MKSSKTFNNLKFLNSLKLLLFCALIGAFAGAVVWITLKIMSIGTEFIWEWIPDKVNIPFYTVAVCTIGGAVTGVFRKKFGDYPEELETVISKIKSKKRYNYKNMLVIIIAALLPLLIGSSVGPEAGLTGIIVGLCYWASDNLKFAKKSTKDYSKIGVAVSLSVLFNSPLFGIFEIEEDPNGNSVNISKGSKIFVYGIALLTGTGAYAGLSAIFGAGMSGFPSFEFEKIEKIDYFMIVLYIAVGILLALFYNGIHSATSLVSMKIPPILKETIAGLCLGITGNFIPAIMFSGEEQMGTLINNYMDYLPLALIGIAFLKILLTNICIQFGLKGGHFFPVIFAGVCMGYGVAMLICGQGNGHMMFAAAIVTATLLGGIMKKPLAVTMLLFLCFPIRMFLWIFISATVGSKIMDKLIKIRKCNNH